MANADQKSPDKKIRRFQHGFVRILLKKLNHVSFEAFDFMGGKSLASSPIFVFLDKGIPTLEESPLIDQLKRFHSSPQGSAAVAGAETNFRAKTVLIQTHSRNYDRPSTEIAFRDGQVFAQVNSAGLGLNVHQVSYIGHSRSPSFQRPS